jgi:hypothetical protein
MENGEVYGKKNPARATPKWGSGIAEYTRSGIDPCLSMKVGRGWGVKGR